MTRRVGLLIVAAAIGIGASVLASALGVLGTVVVCGADRTPGCITWPTPVSEVFWAAFVMGVAALLTWQLRT